MTEVLNLITQILSSMLTWFSTIISFLIAEPILAISIFIPLVFMLIAFVFSFFRKLLNHSQNDK